MMQFADLWLDVNEIAAIGLSTSSNMWRIILKSGYEISLSDGSQAIEELRNYLAAKARQGV